VRWLRTAALVIIGSALGIAVAAGIMHWQHDRQPARAVTVVRVA
jgi:hypothetical protein